jgi:hypothetical protein
VKCSLVCSVDVMLLLRSDSEMNYLLNVRTSHSVVCVPNLGLCS